MPCILITELTTERSCSWELDPSFCAEVFSDDGGARKLNVAERQLENHSIWPWKSLAGGGPRSTAVALITFRKRSWNLCRF